MGLFCLFSPVQSSGPSEFDICIYLPMGWSMFFCVMLPAHCCGPGLVVVYVGLIVCFCLGIVVANLGLAFACVLPCGGLCGFDFLILPAHCVVHLGWIFAFVLPCCGPCGFDFSFLPVHCCCPSGLDFFDVACALLLFTWV